MSTYNVTSWVSIRLVNPNTTCCNPRGLAKSKKLEDVKAIAAGINE